MTAFEHVVEERFRFDVSLRVPLVGLLAHYRGWLVPDETEPETAVAPDLSAQILASDAAADRG